MQVMMNLVLLLQLVAAIAMIGLVLMQHGKGADMGAAFGGGSSGSLFGATRQCELPVPIDGGCGNVVFVVHPWRWPTLATCARRAVREAASWTAQQPLWPPAPRRRPLWPRRSRVWWRLPPSAAVAASAPASR